MKAFLSAVIVAVAIAAAMPYVLAPQQHAASDAFKTGSVRIDDPGRNLIGTN